MGKKFVVSIICTENCNLACPYCYVQQKNGKMNIQTFKNCIPKIYKYMELSNCDTYGVDFFGGEPLLNFKFIKEAVKILKQDPKCIHITIISNLTLINDKIFSFIKDNDINVSFSFDGASSNVSRKMKNGKNILDIYNNKKDLILPLVRGCHSVIYPDNVEQMVENFKYIIDFGINDTSMTVVRDDVWSESDVLKYKEKLHELALLYIDMIKNGKNVIIGSFFLKINQACTGLSENKRDFICFAGHHGCAISTHGNFYACERFATSEKFNYDKMENPFIFKSRYSPYYYDECKKCDLFSVCNCACMYSQLMNNNSPIKNVCSIFRVEFLETLFVLEQLKDNPYFRRLVKHKCESLDNINKLKTDDEMLLKYREYLNYIKIFND